MFAISQVRKFIEKNPDDAQVPVLTNLVLCLQSDEPFPLSSLYDLKYEQFELALGVITEWRLDRYYSKKKKLLGVVSTITKSV